MRLRFIQAIIYVLDSTDAIRMCVAKDELEQLVEHKEFASRRIPILFFANKMDLANALTPVECMEQLELDKLPGKSWHIAYVNSAFQCPDLRSHAQLCGLEQRK